MKNSKKPQTPIEYSNRYDLLSDKESENDEMEMDTGEGMATKPKKNKKPPPLVLHGTIQTHAAFMKTLKDLLKENYYIKYHENFTEVFTTTQEQYTLLKDIWIQKNFKFHTYTNKTEKRKTYVIQGLHNQTEIEDIERELKELGYTIQKINLMKNTKHPKHMVIIVGNTNINKLKQEIRHINNVRVTWENYVSKKGITQCHRCQAWGHATTNCYARIVCLKCAGEHWTRECTKNREEPAKCANCGKDHPANSTKCEEYQKRVKLINTKKPRNVTNHTKTLNIMDGRQFPMINATTNTSSNECQPLMNKYSNTNTENRNNNIQYSAITKSGRLHQATHTRTQTGTTATTEVTTNTNPQPNQPNILGTRIAQGNSNQDKGDLSDFISLTNEINQLNKLVNIKQMLDLVRELNNQIKHCSNKVEQFQIFIEFCQKINNE
ncbi:uncharacterized protein LOC143364175 [Halictus rubicundus]|uniref:uncharacterized protein LOC143364175 n=1 Tax=Halictus rubicundus TaxID=77578 RepID=UPI0040353AE6